AVCWPPVSTASMRTPPSPLWRGTHRFHLPFVSVLVGLSAVYYYYYYAPPIVVQEPPVYIQQQPPPPASSRQDVSWYYCPSAKAYYPWVRTCPETWVEVPPRPP